MQGSYKVAFTFEGVTTVMDPFLKVAKCTHMADSSSCKLAVVKLDNFQSCPMKIKIRDHFNYYFIDEEVISSG